MLPLVSLATQSAAAAPTVLITGSNRGIGLEFARQFAELGWRVIATIRNPEDADELKAIRARHPALVIERMDVTDQVQVDALAARYRGQPIDVLLNNAALLTGMDRQTLETLDFEVFERTLAVNSLGPMRVSRAFLPNVLASQQKMIVTLSSAASSHGLVRVPSPLYAYRASKAALNMLMHILALDLADRGVRVALLNPGLVDTRGVMALKPGDPVPEEFKNLMPAIRSGQLVLITPEESVRRHDAADPRADAGTVRNFHQLRRQGSALVTVSRGCGIAASLPALILIGTTLRSWDWSAPYLDPIQPLLSLRRMMTRSPLVGPAAAAGAAGAGLCDGGPGRRADPPDRAHGAGRQRRLRDLRERQPRRQRASGEPCHVAVPAACRPASRSRHCATDLSVSSRRLSLPRTACLRLIRRSES